MVSINLLKSIKFESLTIKKLNDVFHFDNDEQSPWSWPFRFESHHNFLKNKKTTHVSKLFNAIVNRLWIYEYILIISSLASVEKVNRRFARVGSRGQLHGNACTLLSAYQWRYLVYKLQTHMPDTTGRGLSIWLNPEHCLSPFPINSTPPCNAMQCSFNFYTFKK